MRLDLERSGGGSRRSVVIPSVDFTTVGVEESNELLVLGDNSQQNICVYYCSGWCWIFRRYIVCHIFLILKSGISATHNIFHEVGLSVSGLFQCQFYGFGEFYVRFSKMGLESNPCFMDLRKTISGLDGFVELYSCFRVEIAPLVVAMSMCSAISVEICRHWLMSLDLAMSGQGSRRSVVNLSDNFTTVGGE